jgi:hypothetical protein
LAPDRLSFRKKEDNMGLSFLRGIWADIRQGHNVEVYFTVLICLVVIVLNLFSIVDLKTITSAILAVLSLEAIGMLTNRRAEQELKQSLEDVLKRQHHRKLSEALIPFGESIRELSKRLLQADEVWILSRTCRRLWTDYGDELQTIARRDGLRLMILDPNDGALNMVARSAIWQQPGDGERLKSDVEQFVNRLNNIRGTLRLNGFEVRLIDYLPAWTMILINPRQNDGIIYVELATYRSHPRKRPSFAVECSVEFDLFDQLRGEFDEMWNRAQPAWEPAGFDPSNQRTAGHGSLE